ncbi:amidase [Dermatobacter hominis]|uniref:amidase n=1 Tax=Dermatobacter hominis TaxID=2884263 RepID=UPI001D10E2F4|nr:amidase [Dermatobacter hominis]UDY37264.1 amidase [Dermatobacter hominis]
MTSTDGPGTRPRGSVARSSFIDARSVLAAHPPGRRRRVPFDYDPPPAADLGGRPAPRRPASAAGVSPDAAGPLHDAVRALRAGMTSSVELLQRSVDAVAARNEELVGVVAMDVHAALAEAAALDLEAAEGVWRGPLHGVPITVKDVIDVAGLPTRCGSDAYLDHPERDAVAVARARSGGAVPFAKVATHEFALGVTSPQSRNPRDPSRIPGGSSGGSAVAVATGMGLASIGTDTRASIRIPSALSGAVGLKPTYGRVPTEGIVSLAWTMDHAGVIAASVADAALVLDELLGGGRRLAAVSPLGTASGDGGLRIGVVGAGFDGADPALQGVVEGAIGALGSVPAVAVGLALRPTADDLELANAAGLVVSRVEAAAAHRTLGLDRTRYWEEVADQLDSADEVTGIDYLDAQRVRAELAERLLDQFRDHDVLAMPTSPVVAPPADDFARFLMVLSRNAIPWSFVGFPALSVPCGTVDGLPVGLQLVAPPDREDLLVSAGTALERALGT